MNRKGKEFAQENHCRSISSRSLTNPEGKKWGEKEDRKKENEHKK